ncbi:hypothetical protein [Granulicella paludicola]|uniref:hypothetical protein n=1 Tax=Granulicella paludicola TaxID=474951 RepID=UPI0021E09225|nr:hypothetical protein [Granulicella paludicola]
MKVNFKSRCAWLVGGALLLLTATPSFALFGVGDIVFDPTSYASLVSQATTALNQFKLIENNIVHFSVKQQWQTTLNTLKNANVANMFGETVNMTLALNTNSPTTSTTAWKTATVPVSSNTSLYLQGQTVGNSPQLSQLAMVEMSDSISPDCLTAVGQYRATRTTNTTANNALLQQQFDVTSATNSEVQQLNLLNAAEAQKLSETQSQGQMQVCLASQMTVANMQQRNAAAQDLNSTALIYQQRSVNDVSAANEDSTWQTYLP